MKLNNLGCEESDVSETLNDVLVIERELMKRRNSLPQANKEQNSLLMSASSSINSIESPLGQRRCLIVTVDVKTGKEIVDYILYVKNNRCQKSFTGTNVIVDKLFVWTMTRKKVTAMIVFIALLGLFHVNSVLR